MTITSPTVAREGTTPQGYSSRGQNQFLAGENAAATLLQSVDKGGMRGIGLVVMAIAEYLLKKKAVDLAKDYYNTNRRDYDFYNAVHKAPLEASVNEAFSPATNPKYKYDYYASAPAGIAKSALIDKQWYETRRRVSIYNIGQARRLDYSFAMLRTHAVVAGWNLANRYETTWTDEHNARAFERKVTITNIGIGVGNVVREGMAAAVSRLATSYDHIGDTVASIGNGYAAKSGYSDAREDVRNRYPSENR